MAIDVMVLGLGFNLINCRHPCPILPFLLEVRDALGMRRQLSSERSNASWGPALLLLCLDSIKPGAGRVRPSKDAGVPSRDLGDVLAGGGLGGSRLLEVFEIDTIHPPHPVIWSG